MRRGEIERFTITIVDPSPLPSCALIDLNKVLGAQSAAKIGFSAPGLGAFASIDEIDLAVGTLRTHPAGKKFSIKNDFIRR